MVFNYNEYFSKNTNKFKYNFAEFFNHFSYLNSLQYLLSAIIVNAY